MDLLPTPTALALLSRIHAGEPMTDLSFEEQRTLKECYDAGWFEGSVPVEMIGGRVVVEVRFPLRLTMEGHRVLATAQSSQQVDQGIKPDHANVSQLEHDLGRKSLFWARASVIGAAVIFLLSTLVAVLIALYL